MFDIGFAELLVIAVLGLIVIGPQRLPEVVRSISLWIGRLRRSFSNLKGEMEKEFQLDEIRRQLHNEEIMQKLSDTRDNINSTVNSLNKELHSAVSADTDNKDSASDNMSSSITTDDTNSNSDSTNK